MPLIVDKNTFLAFEDRDCDDSDSRSSFPQASTRSKSAEISRSRPFSDARDQFTKESLERLNAVLSAGMSGSVPVEAPEQGRPDVRPDVKVDVSGLHNLQKELGKALSRSGRPVGGSPSQAPCAPLKQIRAASNGSLSTMMSEDDVSEHGEISSWVSKGVRHVCSSVSVNTMASDWDDRASEAYDVDQPRAEDQHARAATLALNGRTGRIKGYVTQDDFSHRYVPRNQNLEEVYKNTNKDAAPTTMMIRNIPNWYSQQDLMMDLKEFGFAGTFDFLYIPMDKATSASVGYSFVNFVDPSWAEKCMSTFQNFRFKRHHRGSSKVATVSVAHLQGLERNLQHYENTAVNASRRTMRRPVVMPNIAKMLI